MKNYMISDVELFSLSNDFPRFLVTVHLLGENEKNEEITYLCQIVFSRKPHTEHKILVEGKDVKITCKDGFQPFMDSIIFQTNILPDGREATLTIEGERTLYSYKCDSLLKQVLEIDSDSSNPAFWVKYAGRRQKHIEFSKTVGIFETKAGYTELLPSCVPTGIKQL